MRFLAESQNRADPTPWMEAESAQMAVLVAGGLVEHMYVKADYSGVVLIIQASDSEEGQRQLSTLPLVVADITSFSLTAIIDPSDLPA